MKRLFNWKFFLATIILLGAFLRLWQLGIVPHGFHLDEASYGYNAYSLLLTGKDEYGISYPWVLKSFGEYKPALYAYFDIPWIAAFGLNPFSVRIVSSIFGLLTIPLLYLLTNKLLNNRKIALITAFLLAVSPWHLTLSRTTSEVVVSVFFILLLVYAVLFLKEKFHWGWFALSVVSGLIAINTYTASRFFVVLLMGLLVIFFTRITHHKVKVNGKLLLLCCIFIGIGFAMTFLDSAHRFNQISILSTPETKLVIDEQIREDKFSQPLITRLFHNKFVNYARTIAENFGAYFTMDFFFLKGGFPDRMIVPSSGLFYFWQLPFLILGLYVLFRKRNALSVFLIGWWLLLLIPATMTYHEIPNVFRSLVVLPAILIIIAIGLHKFFFEIATKKIFVRGLLGLLVIVGSWEFLYFQHQYYVHLDAHHPWYMGYAYRPLAESLNELSPHYRTTLITKGHGSPYIFLLFYDKYNPAKYQQAGSPSNTDKKGYNNYYFLPQDCISADTMIDKIGTESGVLQVVRGDCKIPKKQYKVIKTIYWEDHNPAFKLIEFVSTPAATLRK